MSDSKNLKLSGDSRFLQKVALNALRRVRCRVWPDAKAGAWRQIGPECLDGC